MLHVPRKLGKMAQGSNMTTYMWQETSGTARHELLDSQLHKVPPRLQSNNGQRRLGDLRLLREGMVRERIITFKQGRQRKVGVRGENTDFDLEMWLWNAGVKPRKDIKQEVKTYGSGFQISGLEIQTQELRAAMKFWRWMRLKNTQAERSRQA